ncbi:hypothetical protein JOB18_017852 [Solea senegalensis]|uniref:Uncharacterized protein n=1 Tax=Solea senegalensis TaxID=28829 RepID=A0AAV6RT13_SOLSE|nr:hypothetical protein JOB18_017852 [Solea senegalensis]
MDLNSEVVKSVRIRYHPDIIPGIIPISSWYHPDNPGIILISSWYHPVLSCITRITGIIPISSWYNPDIILISSWYNPDIILVSS